MTFPNIAVALTQGYSINKIIDWLMKHNKTLGASIKEALNQGYSKDQIADYLTKQSGMSFGQKQEALSGMTEKEKADRLLYRRTGAENRLGSALTSLAEKAPLIAAGAAAVPLAGRLFSGVSPVALQMVANRFPRLASFLGMQPGQQAPGAVAGSAPIAPNVPPPVPPAGAAQAIGQPPPAAPNAPIAATAAAASSAASSVPSAAPATPAPGAQAIAQGGAQLLTGNISTLIKGIVQSGYKDVPTVVGVFESLFPGWPKKFEKENGMPFEQAVADYLAANPAAEQAPDVSRGLQLEKQASTEPETLKSLAETSRATPVPGSPTRPEQPTEAQAEAPKVGELGSADGHIGTVRAIRNGKALIEDSSGKKHQVNAADIVPEPASVRNTKISLDLSKVPEKLKSAMLSFVFVPKSKSDIILRMGTGRKAYRYWRKDGQPIDEAQIEKLREGSTVPVTEGDEFLGSWNPNEADSRGSAASREIVQNADEWSPEKEANFEGSSKGTAYAAEVPMPKEKEYWSEEVDIPFLHGYWDQFENEIDIAKEMFDREKAARLLREGKRKRARKEKEIERRFP